MRVEEAVKRFSATKEELHGLLKYLDEISRDWEKQVRSSRYEYSQ